MALAFTRSSIAQCLPRTLTRRLYGRLLLGEFGFFFLCYFCHWQEKYHSNVLMRFCLTRMRRRVWKTHTSGHWTGLQSGKRVHSSPWSNQASIKANKCSVCYFLSFILDTDTILYYTMCTLYYYTIPSSRDLLVNRNMSLYGDLSALYLGVKNNNDDTPEFLTLCPCLNLWCFFSIFGHNILGWFQRVLVLLLLTGIVLKWPKMLWNTINLDKEIRTKKFWCIFITIFYP